MDQNTRAPAPAVPEGWSLKLNADGTVGVIGPPDIGGDTSIANAGRFEQRLLYGLVRALIAAAPSQPGEG